MRRAAGAVVVGVVTILLSGTGWAAPPTHESSVNKNVAITIPPLEECPAGAATSIDLVFNDQFHLTSTDATFHFTSTQTGTFTVRGPQGEALATGHFTTTDHDQGPGFPTEAFTSILHATGRTADGTRTSVHILRHFTITPAGDVTSEFERISC